jgi:hypothetical protein
MAPRGTKTSARVKGFATAVTRAVETLLDAALPGDHRSHPTLADVPPRLWIRLQPIGNVSGAHFG